MTPMDLEREVERIYLLHYVPAGMVINEEMEILQFRGATGPFLEPRPGRATLNLLKLIKPGIAYALQHTIQAARNTGQRAVSGELSLPDIAPGYRCTVEVFPLTAVQERKLFLVIFKEKNRYGSGLDKQDEGLPSTFFTQEPPAIPADGQAVANHQVPETATGEPVPIQPVLPDIMAGDEETPAPLTYERTEAFAETVLNTVPEAIVVIDTDLRVKKVNTAFCDILGRQENEVLHQPLYELLQDGSEITRQLLENLFREEGPSREFEMRLHPSDSSEKLIRLNGRKISTPNEEAGLLLLTIEEVTGRKKAEQILAEREAWLHNMTDNIPVMICLTGPDNTGSSFNSAWIRYTGRTREQEENGGWITGIHPEDISRFTEMLNIQLADRKAFQLEFRLRRHDGKYRWISNCWQPVFTQEGLFTGYIICCTEVHDKKIMQEELEKEIEERTADLQRMNKELEQYNTELQQFTYVSSHDLQEPLRKIITYSDRLQERFREKLQDNGKDYIGKIIGSARYMSHLINDLLEYTRISRSEEKFVKTDLNGIFGKVLRNFDRTVREKHAVVQCDKLPVVDAMPQQMEQLFNNLLSNALKFTNKDRAPVIIVSVKKLSGEKLERYLKDDKPSLYYEIIVQDNGIGFGQQYADQVFTIFQRLHGKQDFPGTGIGLALCRKIIYHHKGDIYAQSKENEGTEFHVILPARQSPLPASSPLPTSPKGGGVWQLPE